MQGEQDGGGTMTDITDYVPVVEVSGSTSFDVIIGMDIFTKGDFSFTSDSENSYFFMRIPHSDKPMDLTKWIPQQKSRAIITKVKQRLFLQKQA